MLNTCYTTGTTPPPLPTTRTFASGSSCADLLLAADSFIREQQRIQSLLPQLSIAKMDPLSQVFCLRWNNHRNNLLTVFDHLLQTEAFCDVTLAVDGASVKCHKMILSACSSYFQTLFMENQCEHPIVFLKDIKYDEIRAVLDYMYKGEVNVAQEQLPGLLKVAELLRVKGLVEEERDKMLNSGLKEGRPVVSTSDDRREEAEAAAAAAARAAHKLNLRDRDHHHMKEPATPGSNGPQSPALRPPFGAHGMGMWPSMFPGMLNVNGGKNSHDRDNNGHASSSSSLDRLDSSSSANANDKESSPSPKEPLTGSAKRKKTTSGSGGSSSSKEGLGPMPPLAANGPDSLPLMIDDKLHDMEHDKNHPDMALGLPPGMDGKNLAGYVPNQRLEWKRYKQYTRQDIMAAIEEVKKGMSALQASRKYGVPSRTLYDKVKKMGITTGRQMQRKSIPAYPAAFPGAMGQMPDFYKEMAERINIKDDDNTNDSSSAHGSDIGHGGMDGRATLVPHSGAAFPTQQTMLNILEKMKENSSGSGKGEHRPPPHLGSDISFLPMNLTTMLGNVRSSNASALPGGIAPRAPSESSMSPNGGHDDVDVHIEDDDAERQRHNSADVRAQFMADLRRLGGNVPTQSGQSASSEDAAVASSTTGSPPPAPPSTHSTPQKGSSSPPSASAEKDLPPRKRKVSQEQHAGSGNGTSLPAKAPYNGIHEEELAEEEGAGRKSPSSGSSEKEASLECKN